MSTVAPHPAPFSPLGVGPTKRWSTAEFDALVRQGFIREGSRTYLWDGEIIEPMAEDPPHVNAVALLLRLLITRLPDDAWTVNQNAPVELEEGYKPQPDLSVVKGPRDEYAGRVPRAGDVGLLIEVAHTPHPKDSGVFLRKYAAVGIPVYWIVNIPERRIEVYTDPTTLEDQTSAYARRTLHRLGESVPLFTRHAGVTSEYGELGVREVLRNSLVPPAKE